MRNLIIFGNAQIAEIANFYFRTDSTKYRIVAFCADGDYISESSFEGLPVIPFEIISDEFSTAETDMFIAMSYAKMNKHRQLKYKQCKDKGFQLASYISSKCSFMSHFVPGDNCFILEDNTIQPFVRIGNNVTLWSGNHVGHHSIIEDHNFISSHVVISGNCRIESNCFLGVNATLHNDVVVSEGSLIGAGAIITKSTKPKEVYLAPRSNLYQKASDEIDF